MIRDHHSYRQFLDTISHLNIDSGKKEGYILLDGMLESIHNLQVNIAIGIAANRVLGLNPIFLITKENGLAEEIACVMGIKTINIATILPMNMRSRFRLYFDTLYLQIRVRFKGILKLKLHGIPIGDLIYDDIIRKHQGAYTEEKFTKIQVAQALRIATKNYHAIRYLLKEYDVKYITLSHKYYTSFGVISRYALGHGIKFISKNRAHLRCFDANDNILENDYYVHSKLRTAIERIPLSEAISYNERRFQGTLDEDHNVGFAFTGKETMEEEELISLLRFNRHKPVAAIMPHAFSDAPHSGRSMIYDDYYLWLQETLKIVKNIPHIQWIIKPHPGSVMYNEQGVVSSMIQETENLRISPGNISTESILKISDAIVTVRGTAALECILFDAQPVVAGDSYYVDLGFAKNCLNESEYIQALSSITKKKERSQAEKEFILKLLFWRRKSYLYHSNIFGPEYYPGMSSEEINSHEINNCLQFVRKVDKDSYELDPYFTLLLRFFKEERRDLSAVDFQSAYQNDKSWMIPS